MVTPRRPTPTQKWFALVLAAATVVWTVFVLTTIGSAEERYFRTCTGSCLAEMPDSYRFNHALLAVVFIVVPVALVAGAWIFFRWLVSTSE